jgi:hypothetical protein
MIKENDGMEECGNWSTTDPISRDQPSTPRWQDIKTAPKNGTKIIGGTEDDDETVFVCAWDAHDGFNDGDWLQYGSDVVRPTKWIPMPAEGDKNANDK